MGPFVVWGLLGFLRVSLGGVWFRLFGGFFVKAFGGFYRALGRLEFAGFLGFAGFRA